MKTYKDTRQEPRCGIEYVESFSKVENRRAFIIMYHVVKYMNVMKKSKGLFVFSLKLFPLFFLYNVDY